MASFELWKRETLNQFANEALEKLLAQDEEIKQLQQLIQAYKELIYKDAHLTKEGPPVKKDILINL